MATAAAPPRRAQALEARISILHDVRLGILQIHIHIHLHLHLHHPTFLFLLTLFPLHLCFTNLHQPLRSACPVCGRVFRRGSFLCSTLHFRRYLAVFCSVSRLIFRAVRLSCLSSSQSPVFEFRPFVDKSQHLIHLAPSDCIYLFLVGYRLYWRDTNAPPLIVNRLNTARCAGPEPTISQLPASSSRQVPRIGTTLCSDALSSVSRSHCPRLRTPPRRHWRTITLHAESRVGVVKLQGLVVHHAKDSNPAPAADAMGCGRPCLLPIYSGRPMRSRWALRLRLKAER